MQRYIFLVGFEQAIQQGLLNFVIDFRLEKAVIFELK